MSLYDAARRIWDVVVVGAGPAGALAAMLLARRGRAVCIVDRATFPRSKVCGCCLNLRAKTTLASAGQGDLIDQAGGVPLNGLSLAAEGQRASLRLPSGWVLSRNRFDAALIEAALAAGTQFLPGVEARLGATTGETRLIHLRQGKQTATVAARMALAADGVSGGFLNADPTIRATVREHSRCGAGAVVADFPLFYAPGTIFMACGRMGYVGLVRLENGCLNLAAAMEPAAVKRLGGLGLTAVHMIQDSGFPAIPRLAEAAWRGTPLLTRSVNRPWTERVFAIGDAAGYVEPFTGEGISWALASATAVTPLALAGCRRWESALGRDWTNCHCRLVERRQWMIRSAVEVLRRPLLTRALIALLARMPSLALPFVQRVSS